MASQYSAFLRSPNPNLLASDASLFYITTTTEIKEAAGILKHLQAQQKNVEKKEEKVLNAIESHDGLALETDTTILFKTGGGAYLPGVDENLLDEKTVTFPIMHFVRFDAQQKIKQIRLYWDQGTVLKQVEAIGKSGRNWPIKDGSNQIDAIKKSVKAAGPTAGTNGTSAGVRSQNDVVVNQHRKRESESVTRDPHASLSLFAARDPNEDAASRSYNGPTLAPRESAKPAPRDLVDIVGDDAPGSKARSPSPSKADGFLPKSGAGKHHTNNRLFDENEGSQASRSPERKKMYGGKYEHFAFGDGEDAPGPRQQNRLSSNQSTSNKNASTFNSGDFSTPPKYQEKARPDYNERHWGAGVQDDDPPSPPKRPIVHAARPDAESHFQLADSSPANPHNNSNNNNNNKAASDHRQTGIGHYQDHNLTTSASAPDTGMQMNAAKSRSNLDASWSFGTPPKEKKIYKTAGDGMGGRAGARSWGFGDDSDPEVDADVRPSARSRGGVQARQQAEAGAGF